MGASLLLSTLMLAAFHAPPAAAVEAAVPGPAVLVGPLTREQVERAVPAWIEAGAEAHPDLDAARALEGVEPGAEVTVFLGTWCSDSRREISRLWRAFDQIGIDPEDPANGSVTASPPGAHGSSGGARSAALGGPGPAAPGAFPFTLRYIGVDRSKQQPAGPVAEARLEYVPTLIVCRQGRELGRIVEKSPHGVESDLLALLTGKASGLLSASAKPAGPDREGSAPPPDP